MTKRTRWYLGGGLSAIALLLASGYVAIALPEYRTVRAENEWKLQLKGLLSHQASRQEIEAYVSSHPGVHSEEISPGDRPGIVVPSIVLWDDQQFQGLDRRVRLEAVISLDSNGHARNLAVLRQVTAF